MTAAILIMASLPLLLVVRLTMDNVRLARLNIKLIKQLEAVSKSHERLTSGVIEACHEQMRREAAVRERARVAQWN